MDKTVQVDPVTNAPVAPPTVEPQANKLEDLPESWQKTIHELRSENAKHRTAKNAVAAELAETQKKAEKYDAMLKEQAETQGKFKELYEKTHEELEALKPLSEKVKAYEAHFQAQLDLELKAMPETQRNLIMESGLSIEKKLEYAKKLKGQTNASVDSPASTKPSNMQLSPDAVLEAYRKADAKGKAEILFDVEKRNPSLYESIIRI